MATYIGYYPNTILTRAMFNFDEIGWSDFKLNGSIGVSVSDTFSFEDWSLDLNDPIAWELHTTASNEILWTTQ